MKQIDSKEKEYLFEAILSMETAEECSAFFEDVCTIKELDSIAQRLTVARLLRSGLTFNEIVERTGASTATISRVNRCLNYGSGYKSILEKMDNRTN